MWRCALGPSTLVVNDLNTIMRKFHGIAPEGPILSAAWTLSEHHYKAPPLKSTPPYSPSYAPMSKPLGLKTKQLNHDAKVPLHAHALLLCFSA